MQPWPSRSRLDAGNSSRHHREAGQRPGGLWRPWRRARVQHRTRGEPPARLRLGTQPPRALRHVNECTPSQATHPVSGKHPPARPRGEAVFMSPRPTKGQSGRARPLQIP